jgi:hypothetical protein
MEAEQRFNTTPGLVLIAECMQVLTSEFLKGRPWCYVTSLDTTKGYMCMMDH